MSTDTAIEVRGLCKRFAEVQAVVGINFDVLKDEVFGFLGPNGAGKTTTINMLTGLARPDEGTIHIGGIDCTKNLRSAQHLIGVVPDESNLYPELTGFENLTFCAALYGLGKKQRESRAHDLLEVFGLTQAKGRTFGGYSKGMKRKLTLAAGIIHKPPILFLDEPTSGIDVASARQIRQLISGLNASGTTIFLTTHYIEEAERLCNRIAFIVEGRIVRTDTVEDLMQKTDGRHVVEFAMDTGASKLCETIKEAFSDLRCQTVSDTAIRVESREPLHIGPLVRFLEDRGAEISEARKIRPSLEDVFVEVTGIESSAMKREKERAKMAGGS